MRLLDSAGAVAMLRPMLRMIQICLLVSMALSLNSCGLPMAMGRSVGRALNGIQNLASGS